MRHGDTGYTGFRGHRSDDALSPLGWQQMRAAFDRTGLWLPPDRIVCSPLRRCAEFAAEIAAAHGLLLEREAGLSELDFGDWEGRTAEELMENDRLALGRFWEDPWKNSPPNGESLADFEQRVRLAWDRIGAWCEDRRTLVVTHGGVIRMLLLIGQSLNRANFLTATVEHASLHPFSFKR